jgi:hypothetical protein
MPACLPPCLSLPPLLQDFVFNLLTARFDERTGLWAYTIGAMLRLYLRGWFLVDLVSASGCVFPTHCVRASGVAATGGAPARVVGLW